MSYSKCKTNIISKKRIPELQHCTFCNIRDIVLSHCTFHLNWLLSCNSRSRNMLEPHKDGLPDLKNVIRSKHVKWVFFFFWQSLTLAYMLLWFLFSFFSLLHNILGGRWAGMRERLHSLCHHHNHNQERQVCAWLHICGGGHVCFGSHEYFWLSTVGDNPHRLKPQEISPFYRRAVL